MSAPETWYRVARGMEEPEGVTVDRVTEQYVWFEGDTRRTPKDGVAVKVVPTKLEAWAQLLSWADEAVRGATMRLELEEERRERIRGAVPDGWGEVRW